MIESATFLKFGFPVFNFLAAPCVLGMGDRETFCESSEKREGDGGRFSEFSVSSREVSARGQAGKYIILR